MSTATSTSGPRYSPRASSRPMAWRRERPLGGGWFLALRRLVGRGLALGGFVGRRGILLRLLPAPGRLGLLRLLPTLRLHLARRPEQHRHVAPVEVRPLLDDPDLGH